jgi:hypothetical protein
MLIKNVEGDFDFDSNSTPAPIHPTPQILRWRTQNNANPKRNPLETNDQLITIEVHAYFSPEIFFDG